MSTAAAGMPRPKLVDVALAYAARGWKVFPLAPKKKSPLIAKENGGKGYLDATTDAEQIRKWWAKAPNANIGLATGHAFWVLDIDPEGMAWYEANELASMYEVVTGRGGRHLFYAMPEGVTIGISSGKIAPGVDVRGVGGYAAAAPSIHPNGKPYTWIDCDGIAPEGPFSEAPPWLVDIAAKTSEKTDEKGGKNFNLPDQITEGGRNDTLYRFAASMRSHSFAYPEIRAALDAANARCVPPLPSAELDQIAQSACSKPAGKSARFKPQPPDPTDADVPGDVRRPVLVPPAGPRPEPEPEPEDGSNAAPPPEPEPTRTTGRSSVTFLSNETGNADRLAAAHGAELVYCTDRKAYYVWNGRFWEYDEFLQVEKRAEKTILRAWAATVENEEDSAERKAKLGFFNKSLSRKALENMSHLAKKKVRTVKAADFDSDPWLLNVQNGVIDLRDGTRKPHQRDYLQSKLIPIDYNQSAECPLFLKVLHRAMGGDENPERARVLVEYLQRAFGCATTGKPEKMLVLFYGPKGNNSKTTILETVFRTLGKGYALKLPIDTLMIDPHGASNATNSSLADLIGMRFVYTGEVEKGQKLSLAKVKDLLSLGTIQARRLRENWIYFPQQYKIFIDANDRPQITNPTDPIWNRVRCVPFDVQIPDSEIDTDLPAKLDREAPGILRWLIDGARRYMESGLKNYPDEIGASTQAYRDASDRLKEFIAECCELKPNVWVSSAELVRAYENWCKKGGEDSLGVQDFAEQLRGKNCKPDSKYSDKIKTRGWSGIKLLKTKE